MHMQADEPDFRLGPFQRRRWATLCPETPWQIWHRARLAQAVVHDSYQNRKDGGSVSPLLAKEERSGPDTFRPLHFDKGEVTSPTETSGLERWYSC